MNESYSFDIEAFDFDAIHEWLSQTYWSPGISKERIQQGFRNSTVVIGAFSDGKQVGVARCLSDTTRFAYIADVYVHPSFRGRGIARKMVSELLCHPKVADADKCYLFTKDAHEVYKKIGFGPFPTPNTIMTRKKGSLSK